MPKKPDEAPGSQVPTIEALLGLLNAIVSRNGHTLSWYTSKKGRVWATLKGFDPQVYSTSVELSQASPDQETLDTFLVLLYKHVPKVQEVEPPVTSWHVRKEVDTLIDDAIVWALDTYRRWQGGEMFWDGSYPDRPLRPLPQAQPPGADPD